MCLHFIEKNLYFPRLEQVQSQPSGICNSFQRTTPKLTLFWENGTYCLAKKTNRDYEKEKPSHCWTTVFANQNPTRPNLKWKKKVKITLSKAWTFWAPIGSGTELDFQLLIHFIRLHPVLKPHVFLSFQRKNLMVTQLWSRIYYSEC